MFFSFGLKDLIDILLVAIILYYCYKVMKRSRSVNIFYGVLIFVSFWIVISKVIDMKLLGGILNQLVNVGAIALIILFQDEIRHFFYDLGAHKKASRFMKLFRSERKKNLSDEYRYDRDVIFPIVMACINMSKQKVGALIVLENDLPLSEAIQSGETIDARITQRLIENIFFKNSPLHDGAMIISEGKIKAAACILPISHDLDIPKEFGLRHRAGKGITAETDALTIIVSEETGNITAAYGNQFRSHLSAEELETTLMKGRF
ncbi:MAG: diadenylate cyclase CdaA [Bacteroidaceae bacterium]|nr:diadenylate cyclase CdaA [Bacteroidaceae bacterium]MBR1788353.1 diadenylate cyclase CdaA [Bacteroidaceae bacterium]